MKGITTSTNIRCTWRCDFLSKRTLFAFNKYSYLVELLHVVALIPTVHVIARPSTADRNFAFWCYMYMFKLTQNANHLSPVHCIWPRDYKKKTKKHFMLNSAEREIFPASNC